MGKVNLPQVKVKTLRHPLLLMAAVMVCCLSLTVDVAGSQAEKGVAAPAPPVGQAENGQGISKGSALTFMGVVEPGRLFRLILQPTETLQKLTVTEGQAVAEGEPLATLSSDSLSGARFDLLQKRQMLHKEKQLLELAALEITVKERQLERIRQQIAEEKKLSSQVEGFIPTLSGQLERERLLLEGELELLRAKMSKAKENTEQTALLEEMLARQLAEIAARAAMLEVRAPFAGTAAYVSPEGIRTPPGGVVCELWSDSSFRVRGKIMQHQMKYIRSGDRVEIALDFSENKPVFGKIQRIQQSVGKIENQGGYPSFDVLVQVEGEAPWIQAGMLVSLKMSLFAE